jgi:peptidoglycan/xylan/chitin deacetylase (PgdA/CDA1 family)
VIALTIDCGGNAAGIPNMLSALDEAGIPATFFLTGNWVRAFPAESQRIAGRYPMGNHTVSHPHLLAKTDAEVRAEIEDAQRTIDAVLGRRGPPLFRFPYGERDARTLRIAGELGYTAVSWTVDSVGWKGSADGGSLARVIDRVLDAAAPGAIVLMHAGAALDGSTYDADALPTIVERLEARGYRFVTVDAYL